MFAIEIKRALLKLIHVQIGIEVASIFPEVERAAPGPSVCSVYARVSCRVDNVLREARSER